ncbi:nuclear transport factor 2 family protein [Balneolaceae bacterium YR4-1]|uniref:Nuclear transport factor 2 family protein n=1 Tax=Halalkalibaculum roseum TaxID=2709311 RepID=A0A6M1T025_9BACT|nr:nuclear transport factor 2 family protein [Halalkalibaculum roseum]NGP76834.1 nuclear transport factor 2 family protein [Halalkalibaculum roseum]
MGDQNNIQTVIEQFFHAMDTQDYELMDNLIPNESNMVHIGTGVGEIWKGKNELLQATREQFENLQYYRAKIHNLTVNFSDSGNTAWYFHLLDAEIKSNDVITRWENARFTGVLEKQDEQWKMMQTHVSIPE